MTYDTEESRAELDLEVAKQQREAEEQLNKVIKA